MQDILERAFVTTAEVAEYLGVAPVTVRSWLSKRLITKHNFGKSVRINVNDLRRFIDNGTVPSLNRMQAV